MRRERAATLKNNNSTLQLTAQVDASLLSSFRLEPWSPLLRVLNSSSVSWAFAQPWDAVRERPPQAPQHFLLCSPPPSALSAVRSALSAHQENDGLILLCSLTLSLFRRDLLLHPHAACSSSQANRWMCGLAWRVRSSLLHSSKCCWPVLDCQAFGPSDPNQQNRILSLPSSSPATFLPCRAHVGSVPDR